MPITLEQLITPTPAEEIETAVLDLCATGGLATTAWGSGDPIRTIIWAVSQVIADQKLLSVEIAKGGLGDYASGGWAKLWAQEIFSVLFIPAQPATGYVKFTNPTNVGFGSFAAGQLTVAHKVTGKTYRTQEAATIDANSVTPDILIQADEVGTASNAAPGEITTMITTLTGVTVSNALVVFGADEETNQKLVERARLKWGSLSANGPKNAYDYVARTPLDQLDPIDGEVMEPTSTPITRSKTTTVPDTGEVRVYIATATGAPSDADVDKITAAFEVYAEPWGIDSAAVAATERAVSITGRVFLKSSLTEAQIQARVQIALILYFATLDVGGVVISPLNGAVYKEKIENVIHQSVAGIEVVELLTPAVNVELLENEVVVLGAVSIEVVRI